MCVLRERNGVYRCICLRSHRRMCPCHTSHPQTKSQHRCPRMQTCTSPPHSAARTPSCLHTWWPMKHTHTLTRCQSSNSQTKPEASCSIQKYGKMGSHKLWDSTQPVYPHHKALQLVCSPELRGFSAFWKNVCPQQTRHLKQ